MKEKLLNKLIKENKEDILLYFDDISDDTYKNLSENVLEKLLSIKDNKIRYIALETITNKSISINNDSFVILMLELFWEAKKVNTAYALQWAILDKKLIMSSLYKYFLLINQLIFVEDSKAFLIANIFTNEDILKLSNQDYFEYLNYCMIKSFKELEGIENNVYEKKLKRDLPF